MRNVTFFAIERKDGSVVGREKVQLEGIFHEWGMMALENEEGKIVGNQSCAIVEDINTQKVYFVQPEDIIFNNPFPLKLIN